MNYTAVVLSHHYETHGATLNARLPFSIGTSTIVLFRFKIDSCQTSSTSLITLCSLLSHSRL